MAPALFREQIEGEVEFENVHAGFTENAELARGDVRIDELTDGVLRQIARFGSLFGCGDLRFGRGSRRHAM